MQELSGAVVHSEGRDVLPVAVMYGANSSGKSNVLKALRTMQEVLLESVRLNPEDRLDAEPFALDTFSTDEPTSFEIQFILNGSVFRYGYEYTADGIAAEWLFEERPGEDEVELFMRGGDEFSISESRFAEGVGKEGATNSNRLFLSLVAQLNGEVSKSILGWFRNIWYLSGLQSRKEVESSIRLLVKPCEDDREIMNFWAGLNLGFQRLTLTFDTGNGTFESRSVHRVYDAEGNPLDDMRDFDADMMESEGTKKVIEMAGPLFEVIQNGWILLVDELDAKLHPFLTRRIVSLFMDRSVNRKGAQLIFATHDTNLLNEKYLRRDQIWFTEKDRAESTDLYSLAEFKIERTGNGETDGIESEYINGRYGAILFLS